MLFEGYTALLGKHEVHWTGAVQTELYYYNAHGERHVNRPSMTQMKVPTVLKPHVYSLVFVYILMCSFFLLV